MMLIGLGYKFEGKTVVGIIRRGVVLSDNTFLSQKAAEEAVERGEFICGDSNG